MTEMTHRGVILIFIPPVRIEVAILTCWVGRVCYGVANNTLTRIHHHHPRTRQQSPGPPHLMMLPLHQGKIMARTRIILPQPSPASTTAKNARKHSQHAWLPTIASSPAPIHNTAPDEPALTRPIAAQTSSPFTNVSSVITTPTLSGLYVIKTTATAKTN